MTTSAKQAAPTPTPLPPLPPLPADVTSISWWVAVITYLAGEAMAVAVLIGHPLDSATVNGVVAAIAQIAALVGPVVAYITHGKVKAAQIQAHATILAAAHSQ